jgi:gliding motility associated protien GldN
MKNLTIILIIAGFILGLNMPAQSQILDNPPNDGLFPDAGMIDKEPVPYPPIRKSDVMWSKRIWRTIDFRQKMNQSFYYPIEAHNNWRSFMQVIVDALKEGSISAYDISATDEFLVPLTYQEVITRQTVSENKVLTRPYPPYEEYDTVIVSEFNPSKVMRIRVKEDWFFDKQRSQMMVRIIGLCPILMKDRDGEEIPEPLFWVNYSEARPVLAKAQIYNRSNNAERRTYDEVFIKRSFNSYIYKEENVYDRRITQYATGIDALLESRRVKNQLFDFEHDLWEF